MPAVLRPLYTRRMLWASLSFLILCSGSLGAQTWDFYLSGHPEVGNPDGQGTSLDAYLGIDWPGAQWSSSLSASTSLLSRTEQQGPPERLLLTETSSRTELMLKIAEYRLFPGFRLGAGLYQSWEDQLQSGYFRTSAGSPFQAFTLDFKGRSTGPMVTAALSWRESDVFPVSLNAVLVPAFYAGVGQTYLMEPALEGVEGKLEYGAWGFPYVKLGGSADLWKYLSLGFQYDVYSLQSRRLKTGAAGWVPVTSDVWNHSLLWTLGVNLSLGGRNWVQLGVGRRTTWILASGAQALTDGRTVLDLSFSVKD